MARSKNEIEQAATELLRNSNALIAPIDVEKVAAACDVRIHYELMEDQVSGVLVIKDGAKHIFVNRSHHANRQRFSIAHEFGHLVLHDSSKDRLFIDTQIRTYQRVGSALSAAYSAENSTTTPEEEREANQFASALLMPKILVEHAALERDLTDELDVSVLAMRFGVSEQAMSIRLQHLELLSVLPY